MRGNYWTPILAVIAAGLLGTLPANAQWNGGARLPRSLRSTQPTYSSPRTADDDDVYPPTDPHLAAYRADGMPVPPVPPMMGESIPSPSDNPATMAPSGMSQAPSKCEACEQAAHGSAGCAACEQGHCDACEQECGHGCSLFGGECGCKLCCPEACPMCRLFDDCCWLKERDMTLTGYIDAGFTTNGDNPADRWNGPVGFNDRNEFQMNQAYISLEKVTKACDCDWDLGGRIDFMYGTDARWVESAGLEKTLAGNEKWVTNQRFYHLAMVQAYAEVAYADWKVKLGKFITPLEYEVIDSRGNFFYSHSYGFLYGVNFTQTGVLATKTVDENFNWSVGLSSGVDNFFDNHGRVAFTGAIAWTSCDKTANVNFGIITGDEVNGFGNETNQTMYSLTIVKKLNDRLTYVFEHDLGTWANASDPTDDNASGRGQAAWYSIANYLTYQLSCDWWLGGRAEWFRDRDGARVIPVGDSLTSANGGSNVATNTEFEGDFYEYTVGLNYKPLSNPNLVVRPEVRYDTFTGEGHPFKSGTKDNQFLFAVDAVYQF